MKNVGTLKHILMVDWLLEILAERRSKTVYQPVKVHSVTNAKDEIEVSLIFHHCYVVPFFCGLVVNKLKGKELFPDRMPRNHLDRILGRRKWNCCTMENLRYLLCCKWNILTELCGVARALLLTLSETHKNLPFSC